MISISAVMKLNDVSGKLRQASQYGQFAVSEQALKDCNYYCKQDTGALISSSLIHSDLNNGILRWVTPYAEYQYKLPATRRTKNPNAHPEWCQTAQSNHAGQWRRLLEKVIRERM